MGKEATLQCRRRFGKELSDLISKFGCCCLPSKALTTPWGMGMLLYQIRLQLESLLAEKARFSS